jgi:hypothetical protein
VEVVGLQDQDGESDSDDVAVCGSSSPGPAAAEPQEPDDADNPDPTRRRSKRTRRLTVRAGDFFRVLKLSRVLGQAEQDAFRGEDDEAGHNVAAERHRMVDDAMEGDAVV